MGGLRKKPYSVYLIHRGPHEPLTNQSVLVYSETPHARYHGMCDYYRISPEDLEPAIEDCRRWDRFLGRELENRSDLQSTDVAENRDLLKKKLIPDSANPVVENNCEMT